MAGVAQYWRRGAVLFRAEDVSPGVPGRGSATGGSTRPGAGAFAFFIGNRRQSGTCAEPVVVVGSLVNEMRCDDAADRVRYPEEWFSLGAPVVPEWNAAVVPESVELGHQPALGRRGPSARTGSRRCIPRQGTNPLLGSFRSRDFFSDHMLFWVVIRAEYW